MASIGPLGPGTTVNDVTVGTVDWVNPNNVQVQDDVNTADFTSTAGGGLNQVSHYLKATNFGFTVPAGSAINGILMEVRRKDPNDGAANTYDSSVKIVQGGTIGGTEKKNLNFTWGTSYTGSYPSGYCSYGSSSDLWGQTWTPADINASTFGIAVAATIDVANTLGGQIDYIRATVTYTPPPTPSPFDSVTVSENISLVVPNLVPSTSDQVTVSESAGILLPTLKPILSDLVTVSENTAFAILNFGEMLNTENVSVSENIALTITVLFFSISDQVVVSENISVATSSLSIPLLIFEAITVSDTLTQSEFVNLSILESIVVSENLSFDMSAVPGYNMPGSTPQGSVSRWGGLTVGGGL